MCEFSITRIFTCTSNRLLCDNRHSPKKTKQHRITASPSATSKAHSRQHTSTPNLPARHRRQRPRPAATPGSPHRLHPPGHRPALQPTAPDPAPPRAPPAPHNALLSLPRSNQGKEMQRTGIEHWQVMTSCESRSIRCNSLSEMSLEKQKLRPGTKKKTTGNTPFYKRILSTS
jgi:hypothetical protein